MVTKEIRKFLNNKRGETFLWLVIFIITFILAAILVLDFSNINTKSKRVKYAVNQAVKASTLALCEGEELAEGIFLIEPNRARYNFYTTLAQNLSLDSYISEPTDTEDPQTINLLTAGEVELTPRSNSLIASPLRIRELYLINVHPEITDPVDYPASYYSSTINRSYDVEYPSVIAVIQVEIRGVFLRKLLTVGKMSSSQLTSVYD